MKKLMTMLGVLVAFWSAAVAALDLQEAREKGLVGETQAGYVARIGGGGAASALVSEVNLKRRAEYERISAEKGQPVDVVAKIAAESIINGLPVGAKYRDNDGKWVTK